jgi:hypothetical protein
LFNGLYYYFIFCCLHYSFSMNQVLLDLVHGEQLFSFGCLEDTEF